MKALQGTSRFARSQRMAIVNGILVIIVLIIILQLWLFTATMNAYLGGDYAILLPAALVSLFCLALIGGLIWYLYRLEE
jgi:F0F1-type ATP synthase assembly protein I